jgi:sulfur carrier protein ThiS adenylyltransferase
MSHRHICILVNEQSMSISEGLTAGELRDRVKPNADVLVINGFPAQTDIHLKEGDKVVFIRRGEIPKADELEALMAARHTPGVHERMKKSIVGIAGLGGLGSTVAIALARIGIGTLIIADFDMVEPSNLNRQHFFIEQIGMAKTDAMSQLLEKINPYIRVIPHNVVLERNNIPKTFENADVIVECFDRVEAKTMLIETVAVSLPETYIIGASGLAGYGDSNSIKSRKLGEKIYIIGDLVKAAEPGRGLMAPRVGVAANHQANLTVSLLMGFQEELEKCL